MNTTGQKTRNSGAIVACAFLCAALMCAPVASIAQVLGSCGTPSENEPAQQTAGGTAPLSAGRMPLPGEHAINFELPAVVGDDIKMVKLSDYNGAWRVVCFYPADFTFV